MFAQGIKRTAIGLFASIALLILALPGQAQLVYNSQNSATTFLHSGLCTQGNGVVWDTDFATLVNNAVGPANYNEIAFTFNQCFGGGMIDELEGLNLRPASYTSAARHNEFSFARTPNGGVNPFNTVESTYNRPYSPVVGGAAAQTVRQAAVAGLAGDVAGPNGLKLTNPQYTSSGASGDSITLHRNNPNNPVQNNNYLAVIFGGSTNENPNVLSRNRIFNDLTARGYARNEIYRMRSGGGAGFDDLTTAAALKRAFNTFVKNNTTPDTQVYFWSSWGHGTQMLDVAAQRKAQQQKIRKGQGFSFNADQGLLDNMQAVFNYNQSIGNTDALDNPYFEVETDQAVSGLTAQLNGQNLNFVEAADLFEDGTRFSYRFALSQSDLAALQASSDALTLDWSGDDTFDPGFEHAGLVTGNNSNGVSFASPVPEPTVVVGLAVNGGLLALAILRRRTRPAC